MKNTFYILLLVSMFSGLISAQVVEQDTIPPEKERKEGIIEELKYIKQPGLANAASKIFSSDRRYSISGFLEFNNVNYIGGDLSSFEQVRDYYQDLELYYTGLYRSGTYFGYKFTDKLILNTELQMEVLHYRLDSVGFEWNFELIVDYLWRDYLSFRVGNMPIPLGYVNVMEEPTAFYTVNRPEVERILIPTQWLDQGIMLYGQLGNWEYNIGAVKGLRATDFSEGAFIRPGRFHRVEVPRNIAYFGKLEYKGIDHLEVALAGYHGGAGYGDEIPNTDRTLQSKLSLASLFFQYDIYNFSFFGMGIAGNLTHTDDIYLINERVIGNKVYGYYGEMRCDILPYFKLNTDQKLPVFFRFERLNTHAGIHKELQEINQFTSLNLVNYTIGLNYRPKRNIAFKTNYTLRNNRGENNPFMESDRFEIGVGLIY